MPIDGSASVSLGLICVDCNGTGCRRGELTKESRFDSAEQLEEPDVLLNLGI